ncbi:MAG: tetratricopeptide repeat protein [Gemmatimonadetes bacterium]|nr:tetratricopeptide repeat protein [Gemmatimonadota bacterium]
MIRALRAAPRLAPTGVALAGALALPAVSPARAQATAAPPPAAAPPAADGPQLFDQRKFAEARAVFSAAVKANPRDAQALTYMGRLAFNDSSYDVAAGWFEKAAAIDTRNPQLLYWLGRAYGRDARKANVFRAPGLAKKARDHLIRALEIDPRHAEAREGLVIFYRDAPGFVGGSMEKAFATLEPLKEVAPIRYALNLGDLYAHEKKWAEAEAAYRAGLAAPGDKTALEARLAGLAGKK